MARILHINTVTTPTNSVARVMGAIADGLRANGHECVIAAARGPLADGDWRIGSSASTLWHAAMSRLTDTEGLHSERATKELIRRIKAYRPDVIHLHNLHGHYLHVPTFFEFLGGAHIPTVLTLHDCWWLTGHCAYYSHRGCAPYHDCCSKCDYHKLEYPISYTSRSGYNRQFKGQWLRHAAPLRLVVPTRWLADEVSRSGLNELPLTIIPNGVPDIEPADTVRRDVPSVLAVAARWTPNKRLEDIIQLADSGLCPYPITVVGDLMGQKLPSSVRHIPHVESERELAALYASSTVLVNPTKADAFGLVTAEAMSHDVPVIGNPATATAEIIGDNGGVAVDTSSVESLVEAIHDVVREPERFAPRDAYLAKYTREMMVDAYVRLIEGLIVSSDK